MIKDLSYQELQQRVRDLQEENARLRDSEKRHKEKASKLMALVAAGPEIIYRCAPSDDLPITFITPNIKTQLGYETQDFMDNKDFWSSRIHPDDAPEIFTNLSRVLKKGDYKHEYRFLHQDGSYHWMYDELKLICDADGNPTDIVGSWIDITRSKMAEAALERERNLLQAVMNGAKNIHLIYLDADFNFVRVNQTYASTCGYAPEEMTGKNHFALYPHAENEAIFRRVRDTGLPFSIEDKPFTFPDQPERGVTYWDWSLLPVKESDGTVSGLVFSLIETTERKKAETVIRDSEERLRKIIENMPVMMDALDEKSNIIIWNKECERVTGYGAEEVIGNPCALEMLYPDRRYREKRNEELVDLCFDFRGKEYALTCKDGSKKTVSWSNVSGKNEIPGWHTWAVGVDITERKMAETQQADVQRELVKRNRFIELILEFLPIGLGVNDIDTGEVTYLNKKFEEIYGWPKMDFPNIADFFKKVFPNPMKRELLRERIMGDIASRDPNRMIWDNLEITTKNGQNRIVSAMNIPIFEQNLMISTVQDLTEKKKLETHIQQSQKMEAIGTLAGGIAHDFNNILSSIIGFTELALDETPKGTFLEDSMKEVYAAGKRAKDLIKQILAFARQSEEKRSPIQPSTLVEEVISFIRSTIPTSIEIRSNIQSNAIIMGNATQIHQVLMNLCTNAAFAMEEEGGVLEISLKDVVIEKEEATLDLKPGGYIEIKVSDTGVGISPEVIGSIFDPYFTTKGPGEGTGMGLAMAQGVVNSYGGKITVDSLLGKGTAFTILLPITKKRPDPDFNLPEPLPKGTENILFVDDEASIAKVGSRMLGRLGYSVTILTSSIDALALFKASPDDFDLVLTDMTMPHMTGDKLAVELMKIRPELPVILCTGYSKRITAEFAAGIGIKAFASKPIVMADLAKTIRKVLDEAKGEGPI